MQLRRGLEPDTVHCSEISATQRPLSRSPIPQVRPVALDAEDEVDEVEHVVVVPRELLQDVRRAVHDVGMLTQAAADCQEAGDIWSGARTR